MDYIVKIVVEQPSTMEDILIRFGLTKNESEVYIGFYKYPLITAADLARTLKMDKSSVYNAVEKLYEKGLLKASQGKRGLRYRATNPDLLIELYNNSKVELEMNKKRLEQFISNIRSNSKPSRDPYISIEYGLEAHMKRMNESLRCKEKLIRERFRVHDFFGNKAYNDFVRVYAKDRVKRKIHLRQLELNLEAMEDIFGEVMKNRKKYLKEVRVLPKELDDNNSIRIWDDTVHIVSQDDDNEYLVMIIKDQQIAKLMKNMYDFIWEASES